MSDKRKNPPAILIRVTEEDRADLREKASESGLSLEAYCRKQLLGKCYSISPTRKAALIARIRES